jgi:transcription initiation factor TFIIH subunit 4
MSETTNTGGAQEGFIVLETNYRLYAYTGSLFPMYTVVKKNANADDADNPLQTAVLNLFVSLKYRFPNLVVGSITRDSVKKALANGITAQQVLVSLLYPSCW